MKKDRDYFKNLLANSQTDQLYDELFELLSQRKSQHQDRLTMNKYDELVLLSGKKNSIEQNNQLGLVSLAEMNTEMSRLNMAVLNLINDLPDAFFEQAKVAPSAPALQQELSISSGLGKGLYWVMGTFIGMVFGGSLIQHNYITAIFTGIAVLICIPSSYEWMSKQTNISLSNSLRVLLILVLISVGLSYAAPQ